MGSDKVVSIQEVAIFLQVANIHEVTLHTYKSLNLYQHNSNLMGITDLPYYYYCMDNNIYVQSGSVLHTVWLGSLPSLSSKQQRSCQGQTHHSGRREGHLSAESAIYQILARQL